MNRLAPLAAAALAAALALAHAGSAAAAAPANTTSTNWSGYAVSGAGLSFSDVKGSWVAPAVTCGSTAAYSSFWVGLGGFAPGSNGLEQIGTSADCRNGRALYYAWYELIPAAAVPIDVAVFPGNTITAEVSAAGPIVTLSIANLTTGATFSKQVTLSANLDVSSAEWIAEAPSTCTSTATCRVLPLASFGTVAFSAASATATDHTGAIADALWAPTAIELRTTGSAGALPTALSADGASFAVATTAAPVVKVVTSRPRPGRSWARSWRWRR
jgi:hypothetical protein